MKHDFVIRKFQHTDVDAFIRLSQLSFAEESLAAGLTPEDFEQETRRIFRWRMIPYKLMTALVGIQWEAFVAEKDGKVVGGGMYIGRNKRMTLTNLMVDPAYRRQGIGQALLVKRLERLAERGFPYVTVQVLDTNIASLENLQQAELRSVQPVLRLRAGACLSRQTRMQPCHLLPCGISNAQTGGCFEKSRKTPRPPPRFPSTAAQKSTIFHRPGSAYYAQFAGYNPWVKACVVQGETVGFLSADFHRRQSKGVLLQPVIAEEGLPYFPAMLAQAGAWLAGAGREAMIVEIPDHRAQIQDYLLGHGWTKQYTWLELIRWLEEGVRQKSFSG